jgi:DNA-binding NarL/FixJ family response regulator
VLADHSVRDRTGADLLDGLSLSGPQTRLLIVHADRWTRQALQAACPAAADVEVVRSTSVPGDTSDQLQAMGADVVLFGVASVDRAGLLLIRGLVACGPRVVVICDACDPDSLLAALAAGASCYLVRGDDPDPVAAVRVAAAGGMLLSPSAANRAGEALAGLALGPIELPVASQVLLTGQRRRVLELLAEGLTNAQIATALDIALATAKSHVSRLLDELSLRHRGQLIAYAHRHGYTVSGSP